MLGFPSPALAAALELLEVRCPRLLAFTAIAPAVVIAEVAAFSLCSWILLLLTLRALLLLMGPALQCHSHQLFPSLT